MKDHLNWKLMLMRVVVNGLAIALTAWLLPGMDVVVPKLLNFLLLGAVFGLLNAFVKPIIQFLTLSLLFVTYGLVIILINTVMLLILEFIFRKSEFPFGGSFGESTTYWFSNFLGNAGLALFLLFALAGMVIWLFNPSFEAESSWLGKLKLPSVNWKEMFSGLVSSPKKPSNDEDPKKNN